MRKLIYFVCGILLLSQHLVAEDWLQWRGPNRNGRVTSELKLTPDSKFQRKWTAQVGIGFSSIVVKGNSLVTMGSQADHDVLTCLNATTGELLWKKSYPAPLDPNLFEGGPTATPAISNDKVFTISRQGLVNCYKLQSGDLIWKYDIVKELKYNVPGWGFAGSPLVLDELVYFNVGSHGICLNVETGQSAWTSSNEIDAAYSSPLLVETETVQQIVMLNAKNVYAVAPLTGELLWSERWITRYGINAADPLILNDHQVLISSGYGKGTGVIEFENSSSDLLWRNREVRTQMSPGVLVDGAVYAIDGDENDQPSLVCFNPENGEPYWREEGFGAGTLLAVNSQLMILKQSGELVVLQANQDEMTLITQQKLIDGKCWTPLVIVGDHLFVRNALGKIVCSNVQ